MIKRLFYILLLWSGVVLSLHADVVVLRSGQRLYGEILLNNEEVIILRQKDGIRYQYPKKEVVAVESELSNTNVAQESNQEKALTRINTQLVVKTGAAYIPYHGWGGTMETHVKIGTRNIKNQPVFLGGAIGYRGVFKHQDIYSWIPLQLAFQTALTRRTIEHRPIVGASFGYAFALNKQWRGGLCAGVDVGMLFRLNQRNAISLSITTQWQQTQINVVEEIDKEEYTNFIGCNIIGLCVKLGAHF